MLQKRNTLAPKLYHIILAGVKRLIVNICNSVVFWSKGFPDLNILHNARFSCMITTLALRHKMNEKQIVDFAMQCGATWAGVERIALTKNLLGVACNFSSEFDAEEFVCYARDFIDNKITRDEEFVLIWL